MDSRSQRVLANSRREMEKRVEELFNRGDMGAMRWILRSSGMRPAWQDTETAMPPTNKQDKE